MSDGLWWPVDVVGEVASWYCMLRLQLLARLVWPEEPPGRVVVMPLPSGVDPHDD